MGKSGSKFDPEKAKWFNHQYLSRKSDEELLEYLRSQIHQHEIQAADDYILKVVRLIKDRVSLIPDLWNQSWFFFKAPQSYDEQVKNKIWSSSASVLIHAFAVEAGKMDDFTKDSIHALVSSFTGQHQIKTGQLMNPLRLLVVGSSQGPGMMDIAETLGKEEFLSRISGGLQKID